MKSKNKNTTKRTETSATSTSSTSTKVSTTIDTLKLFWKQNWHRLLSAFAVLLVVCSIAFSCGVNSKAYESNPSYYNSFSLVSYEDRDPAWLIEYAVNPNDVANRSEFPDRYFYHMPGGLTLSPYPLTWGYDNFTSFPIEIDFSDSFYDARDVWLSIDCLDFSPASAGGYGEIASYYPDGHGLSYSDTWSPLNHIRLCYYSSNVDYNPPVVPILVEYSYIDDNRVIRSNQDVQNIALSDVSDLGVAHSILWYLRFDHMPDNSWITGVQISLAPLLADFKASNDITSDYLDIEVVQQERHPDLASRNQIFLSHLISPSIYVPDTNGSYQEGYVAGLNKGQTEALGVVDWLVEAGDSFMNFQLFKVGSTPVSVGTLFSVIIGTFLLFFILRIFAGG